ncbi:MAG: GNAT family N-acetyltransferase [Pseudomonadota bacterium]
MAGLPQLVTERLVLRIPAPHDADRIVRFLGDEEIVRWLARVPWPYPRSAAEEWVVGAAVAAANGDDFAFAIHAPLLEQGLLGVVTARAMGEAPTLGFWLGKPYWGRGIMTEAVGAVLCWLFDQRGVKTVQSGAFEGNEPSMAIQTRFGFVGNGTSMVRSEHAGGDRLHLDTVLTRDAFIAARQPGS